jgi:predicted helicase
VAKRYGQCGKLGETFRGNRFSACAARQGLQRAIRKAVWGDRKRAGSVREFKLIITSTRVACRQYTNQIGFCQMTLFNGYLSEIQKNLAHGDATEHTHRPALKALLESVGKRITATNEPTRIKCGAPDFNITKGKVPLGHVETKDIGDNLAAMEKGKPPNGEQFARYRDGLPNWILTDYLDFHWYVNGELRMTARLAELDAKGKITPLRSGEADLENLLKAFFVQKALTVGTAKDLAERMAGMTRIICDLIVKTFEHEQEEGWLHKWLSAFRVTLIPDIKEKQFADMFAQTLAYGLFAARVHTPPNKDFSREMAAFNLPKTNPFLRKLFSEIAGVDMPETIAWAVNEIVELLNHADMAAILKDFGKGKGKEDPVVHFYETFLAAYDPKMREVRGVYYTPEPVVSYIVRSIDQLLQTRFNRPKGLADENTLILDPATGTATFLYVVVNEIYQKFAKQKGAWDSYVTAHLLKRIFGFELLMAPYAIAHLKLGMQLQQTGYTFSSDQRLGIYLTNTLEEAAKKSEQLFAGWITEEANAAAKIKKDDPILVVLGNPPYSNFGQMNRGQWILGLLQDYKKDLNETKLNLDDDFIKFIRFAQWRIERTGHGVIGFISSNTYLDGLTHRRMRECLMETFNEIHILNLHGSAKKKEVSPDGSKDENVFDITVGVAIALFVKIPNGKGCKVYHADLWGERQNKYEALRESNISSTNWSELKPTAPHFYFEPKEFKGESEYIQGFSIREAFAASGNAIKTERDRISIQLTSEGIREVVDTFRNCTEQTIRQKFDLDEDSRDWTISKAKADVVEHKDPECFRSILYRPFDVRFTWFSGRSKGFIGTPGHAIMRHMLAQQNMALITLRQTRRSEVGAFLVGRGLINKDAVSLYDIGTVFPLYLSPDKSSTQGDLLEDGGLRPNFTPTFLKMLADKLKLPQTKPHGLPKGITPEDIFNYAYAVFHSPTYRTRYAELLKIDFPRLPLTGDVKLFRTLMVKGAELAALHLMESPKLESLITAFPVKGSDEVAKVQYTEDEQRVWINAKQYFDGVPKSVWEFHIGGYQVCERWLKDRKDQKLSYYDIQHYQKTVVALKETIRLMTEIDATIPQWPIK